MSGGDLRRRTADMKKRKTMSEIIREIVARDRRYGEDAYEFVMEALDYTYRMIGQRRHVSGAELLEGSRRYAIERYGPMARTVLGHWGLRRCEDIGEVVFNLVESRVLSADASDSRDDFKGGYDFTEAFDTDASFSPLDGHGKGDEEKR